MSPAISIIIPVYNAERYLRRCLDSIVRQTMSDFEVICVNDGSTDSSVDILEQFANMDNRFKIYHQTNKGVSATRQVGLNLGGGNFVIHADPDDWVEPDWLECLYEEALRSGAGMVICDFERVYNDRRVYYCQKPSTLNAQDVLKDLLTGRLWGPCWNKLILLEKIKQYDIKFITQMNLWEDLYFNCLLLANGDVKVAYVPKALYHYDSCTNPNSIVRYRKPSHVKSGMILIDDLQKRLPERRFDECWYYRKSRIKDWIFELNIPEYDVAQVYSEINDEYIAMSRKVGLFDKKRYIAMSLKGHPIIAHLLWNAVFRLKKII